jgi:hypothetical protein
MVTTSKEVHQLQGRRMVEGNESRAQQGEYRISEEKQRAEQQAALKRIEEGGIATKVRIMASHDSCPVCRTLEGAYEFGEVPELPHEGCSHPTGCRCVYAPVLDRRGP